MHDGDLPDRHRLKLLASLADGNVLDVGCHDVQNPYLRPATGFDVRKPANLPANYTNFVVGDCQQIATFFPANSFDTIVAGELIEHLECPADFLRGCHRVLRDAGRLLLTTPNPYHWSTVVGNLLFLDSGITFDHINLIPFRAMVALLSRTGWKIERIRNASGGMRLLPSLRRWFLPCPKAIAWQHLYVCRKKART